MLLEWLRVLEYSVMLEALRDSVVSEHCELIYVLKACYSSSFIETPDVSHEDLSSFVETDPCPIELSAVIEAREIIQNDLQQLGGGILTQSQHGGEPARELVSENLAHLTETLDSLSQERDGNVVVTEQKSSQSGLVQPDKILRTGQLHVLVQRSVDGGTHGQVAGMGGPLVRHSVLRALLGLPETEVQSIREEDPVNTSLITLLRVDIRLNEELRHVEITFRNLTDNITTAVLNTSLHYPHILGSGGNEGPRLRRGQHDGFYKSETIKQFLSWSLL